MPICANLWSEKPDYALSLFCPQIITDYHRFLNIKDILIITDFILFWHGNPLLFQSHGFWLRREILHGTSWLRLACASSRLSFPLSFFVHRLAQIITDFLISKDIVIITDFI